MWAYTQLKASSGEEFALTGVILFKDGLFAQQSINEGTPFAAQDAMAHSGPYRAGPKGIHLTAAPTISISPQNSAPLSYTDATEHDISVDRSADELTLVFGSGTVQRFKRIGPADGDIYSLEQGVLAFIDGHFVLVDGDAQGVVTGYGTYKNSGSAYELNVIRWAEAKGSTAVNRRDTTLKATFDGKTLTLADGRTFRVTPRK